ncbi:chromosome partitioning protein ParB [Paenarthrobacter nitroguajacolicus]|uniref:ParB/RepB/Spo0J family partition protein n=1 Tax=Paenarthrobacter nitroguajacolicus TaxID=211146 RepID=UPI0015BF1112|nr:ParB/RepB/Spo0J family partition protein [Paenarthrobacter nitroguajacolicus]NWL11616.1 chromosome partitioning protein ParB [Paenarthrobacter nitroguajacolicus]
MSEKRRGLGRGLGALIPSSAAAQGNGTAPSRPVDLFFPEARKAEEPATVEPALEQSDAVDSKPSPAKSPSKASATKSASTKTSTSARSASKPAASRAAAAGRPGSDVAGTTAAAAPAAESIGSVADVELVEVPGARFAEIPVGDIHPNRKQPRSVFDEDDMAELVHSVREIGVLQPIVVRTSTEKGGEPYELVMGERRWRAVQAAGLETIPAIVRDTTDDDLLRDALLENLHRSQLNPLEEAAAYQQLLEDFGTTHEQLADRIGRSRPQVSNTLRLLKLPPLVQRRVAAGVLSAGHARALLALPDAAAMERMAQKIVAEGMSVRATEESVALYQDPTTPAKSSIPKPNARHERLDYLASSLSDRLDTNVKITLGARKGRVSIEFASVEDLNRIMDVLGPGAED